MLLWTDCEEWSSHSCTAGYIVDAESELVVAPTAWYSPYFARQVRRPPRPLAGLAGCCPGAHRASPPLTPPPVSSHPAAQTSNLLGKKVPGLRDACEKAVAAHAESDLPWLTTVGWDAMITSDGVFFFEGNVAAYRTPRRMFLTPSLTTEFLRDRDC